MGSRAVGCLLLVLGVACAGGEASLRWVTGEGPQVTGRFSGEGATARASTGALRRPRIEGPEEARNHYAPVIAMLVPGYTVRVQPGEEGDSEQSEHGFVWSVPVLFRGGGWRHGMALSYAQYLRSGREVGRIVYRLRVFSIPDQDGIVHLLAGVGGFYDREEGGGPRAEISWLLGEMGRGGGLLLAAYEYTPSHAGQTAEISLAFFIPYVIR